MSETQTEHSLQSPIFEWASIALFITLAISLAIPFESTTQVQVQEAANIAPTGTDDGSLASIPSLIKKDSQSAAAVEDEAPQSPQTNAEKTDISASAPETQRLTIESQRKLLSIVTGEQS